jgi:hypothetical protein
MSMRQPVAIIHPLNGQSYVAEIRNFEYAVKFW